MLIKLQNIEQNLKSQINGQKSHVHRSEDLLLWKQYSLNWSIDSMQSLSKSQMNSCRNQQTDPKIHREV